MSYKKAPTNQSKLSRIIQYAPDIKRFYFIDAKHRSSEYEKFMRELTLFTVSGKNLHDDAPDACAMLGGGGHAAAAGCTVEAEWSEAKRQILDSIRANTPDFEE